MVHNPKIGRLNIVYSGIDIIKFCREVVLNKKSSAINRVIYRK